MTPITEALMWAGIAPPEPGSKKTVCPQCSPRATRQDRKSLSVYAGGRSVSWFCHRCEWQDFATMEATQ